MTLTRVQSAISDMPGYLSDLTQVIHSMSTDSKFVLNQEVMPLIEHTLRMQCDWCSTSDSRPLVNIVKERLTAYLPQINQTIQHTQEQVETIYEDFVEALSLANDVEIDVILQNRLPELIDQVVRVGAGIKTEMGTILGNASAYINEIEVQLNPKCMYILDRYMEQHADSGAKLSAITEPLFNLTEREMVHFGTKWGLYMAGNVTLRDLAFTLNSR